MIKISICQSNRKELAAYKYFIMNSLVIYKSKYGATSQYAEWIAADLNLRALESEEVSNVELEDHDTLIIGSSVYIGKLLISKWLKNNLSILMGKKIFLFVVCGTPANEKVKLESYIASSVPAELRGRCEVYFLPGKMKLKDLSWKDRFMLKMGARLAPAKEAEDMLKEFDEVRKENISELISSIKKPTGKETEKLVPEPAR